MSREDVLQEVKVCIDSMRTVILVKGLGWLALTLAMVVGFGLNPDRRLISGIGLVANQIFAAVVILFVLGMTAHTFWLWRGGAGVRSPIYRSLRDAPGEIVWVYTVAVHRSGVHYRTEVWFCLRDGTAGSISTAPSCDAFLEGVRAICPRATFGYTDEAAARYKQSPSSLLQPA